MKYICPVCHYSELDEPPVDFEICPACGTQFDYHDAAPTITAKRHRWSLLRRRWLEAGAAWFDPTTPRPMGWDFQVQFMRNHMFLPGSIQLRAEPSRFVREIRTVGKERREGLCRVS